MATINVATISGVHCMMKHAYIAPHTLIISSNKFHKMKTKILLTNKVFGSERVNGSMTLLHHINTLSVVTAYKYSHTFDISCNISYSLGLQTYVL